MSNPDPKLQKVVGPVDFTRRVVYAMADELQARLDGAALVRHPGEGGRARENLVRDFFRSLLPAGFSMGTGFVIDACGDVSMQQDIVIHRDGYHPIFSVGSVNYYPIESVAAVIEVKANLSSREVLRSALDNGASVKNLDRTGRGINYILIGTNEGEKIDPEKHNHQVFSAIVAAESIRPSLALDELREWTNSHPRREWPNQLVVVPRFSIAYAPHSPRTDQMRASKLAVMHADEKEPRNTRPILDLTQQLLSFLRVFPTIDYQPSAYLPGSYWGDDDLSIVLAERE